MENKSYCRHCGEHEDEHHEFEGYKIPTGCECHPEDWRTPTDIPVICSKFELIEDEGICSTCNHLEECHS